MRGLSARTITLCFVAALVAAGAAAGLDLGVEARVGNLGFRMDRASTDASLPSSDYFWGISVFGSQPLSDSITVESGFYSDPVLRNTSRTILTYNTKFLSVGLGPVFGLFNDPGTVVKSGLSSFVRLEYPGVIFVTLRSDSSIGGSLVQTGDYAQERTDITLGVYFPNVICTVSMSSRSFDQKETTQEVTDGLTEYTFAAEIYKKNVPYRLRLWMGYEDLFRTYTTGSSLTATLGSVILGTEVDVILSGPVALRAGVEGTIYSFGLDALVGSDSTFLFRSYAGFRVNLDSNPQISRFN